MSTEVPLVKSFMTPFPYAIDVDADVDDARQMMASHGIRHLPVLRRDASEVEAVGVVCERDLRGVGRGLPVREVMTAPPYVVDMEEPVEAIAVALAEDRVDCVLIEKDGKVAGIFTATDACALLGRMLRERRVQGGDDAA